ncbi:hypothetical protein IG631_17416 [Alternaria alternata]|nr:hypothetical protein IG631_17416 [Alternaria alternata]
MTGRAVRFGHELLLFRNVERARRPGAHCAFRYRISRLPTPDADIALSTSGELSVWTIMLALRAACLRVRKIDSRLTRRCG